MKSGDFRQIAILAIYIYIYIYDRLLHFHINQNLFNVYYSIE